MYFHWHINIYADIFKRVAKLNSKKGYPNKIDEIDFSFPTLFKDKYKYLDIDKGIILVQIRMNLLRYNYKKGLSCL